MRSFFSSSSVLDVTNVIVWGNISGSFYIDLQRAKVFNYDGAIKGPAFFSQPVLKILHDRSNNMQELTSLNFFAYSYCQLAFWWAK